MFIKIRQFKFVTLNAQCVYNQFKDIVDPSLFLMLLNLKKNLSPEQLVTIKPKKSFIIASLLRKSVLVIKKLFVPST